MKSTKGFDQKKIEKLREKIYQADYQKKAILVIATGLTEVIIHKDREALHKK